MYETTRRNTGETWSNDATKDDLLSRWGAGVVGALLPVAIGVWAIVTQHAYFLGRRPNRVVEYYGEDAIALGIVCVAVGIFAHGHYFWSVSRYYFISEILKPASLLAIAGGIGYVAVSQIIFH